MAYTPNPYDATQPVDSVFASTAAAEFRALKLIIAALGVADPFVGDWSTLTGALPAGKIVSHTGSLWMALVALADVTLSEPTDVNTDWSDIRGVSITEVVEKTAATGSAKLPGGTTAERDVTPQPGWTRWNSTLGVAEIYSGTEWIQTNRQVSAVVATTSGTSHPITGIPAYATRVELHLDGCSTNGTQNMLVQAGTSAGLVVTGYAESAAYDIFAGGFTGAITAGFPVPLNAAAATMRGTVTLFRKPGTNRWECQGLTSRAAGGMCWTTGYIDLPGALDRIALSRAGADTFDLGAIWATWN